MMDSVEMKNVIDAAMALDLDFLAPTLSSKLPPSVDIKQLIAEYKKFLVIKVTSKDTQCPMNLSPSSLIDQVWHEHILNTAKYREACTVLGVFIDHDPSGAMDEDDIREKRLLLTTTHYSLIFNNEAPLKFWELKYKQLMSSDDDEFMSSEDDAPKVTRILNPRKKMRGGIQIFVTNYLGKVITLEVKLSESIESVKSIIKVGTFNPES